MCQYKTCGPSLNIMLYRIRNYFFMGESVEFLPLCGKRVYCDNILEESFFFGFDGLVRRIIVENGLWYEIKKNFIPKVLRSISFFRNNSHYMLLYGSQQKIACETVIGHNFNYLSRKFYQK